MTRIRVAAAGGLLLLFATPPVGAQDFSRYRDYQLGSSVRAVAALNDGVSPVARLVHERPALMQQLEWRPSYLTSGSDSTAPIQHIVFSFYNDQLHRIVVDYDRGRTEGLTNAEIIGALTTTYGAPSRLALTDAPATAFLQEAGATIATWHDDAHAVVLHRSQYTQQFRLIVTERQLDALARTAARQAVQLDQREAPGRELARQKKTRDDAAAAAEKTAETNRATFTP